MAHIGKHNEKRSFSRGAKWTRRPKAYIYSYPQMVEKYCFLIHEYCIQHTDEKHIKICKMLYCASRNMDVDLNSEDWNWYYGIGWTVDESTQSEYTSRYTTTLNNILYINSKKETFYIIKIK